MTNWKKRTRRTKYNKVKGFKASDIATEYYKILGKHFESKLRARKNFTRLVSHDINIVERAIDNIYTSAKEWIKQEKKRHKRWK